MAKRLTVCRSIRRRHYIPGTGKRQRAVRAICLVNCLERVYSLRSRIPKKAKTTICKLVLNLRSQFFQSRLCFSNQEKLRPTTHRFGNTAKRCNSFRLAIPTPHPSTPVPTKQMPYPCNHRRKDFCTAPRLSRSRSNAGRLPFLSVTSTVVTARACGKPCVSTAICRLIPLTFLPAS
ncbi:Uncharacterised protein [Cardiobacterium valvarum]|uniref:Uncharacterized protein n=1 Tax=Cardiobacterium valvarum TaxID=194702 RepID=A0A381E8Z7_9GAMM|nr:Uncharacterised protein [Cardiobacterium valvarum]